MMRPLIVLCGISLVVSQSFANADHQRVITIQPNDVIEKSAHYKEYLDGVFDPQNLNQKKSREQVESYLSLMRFAQSSAPTLLGIKSARDESKTKFKVAATSIWGVGLILSALQIGSHSQYFPEWLMGYPAFVQVALSSQLLPVNGRVQKTLGELMRQLALPVVIENGGSTTWYQLGRTPIFSDQPKLVQALVTFDTIERAITSAFSNGQPEKYNVLVEKYLFKVASRQPLALEGWLFRYLQQNNPAWQRPFELHLLASPILWWRHLRELHLILEEEPYAYEMGVSIRSLKEEMASLSAATSLTAKTSLQSARACKTIFQWFSDFNN